MLPIAKLGSYCSSEADLNMGTLVCRTVGKRLTDPYRDYIVRLIRDRNTSVASEYALNCPKSHARPLMNFSCQLGLRISIWPVPRVTVPELLFSPFIRQTIVPG